MSKKKSNSNSKEFDGEVLTKRKAGK